MCQAGRNRLDDTRLALQENNAHLPARDTTCTNDGINHLGFRIEGMDAPVDRMAAAGYRPTLASALDGHAYRRRAPFECAMPKKKRAEARRDRMRRRKQ